MFCIYSSRNTALVDIFSLARTPDHMKIYSPEPSFRDIDNKKQKEDNLPARKWGYRNKQHRFIKK